MLMKKKEHNIFPGNQVVSPSQPVVLTPSYRFCTNKSMIILFKTYKTSESKTTKDSYDFLFFYYHYRMYSKWHRQALMKCKYIEEYVPYRPLTNTFQLDFRLDIKNRSSESCSVRSGLYKSCHISWLKNNPLKLIKVLALKSLENDFLLNWQIWSFFQKIYHPRL